jgi:hypothetical protein
VVEGARLEIVYTVKRIEGSNPSRSAINKSPTWGFVYGEGGSGGQTLVRQKA